MSSESRCRAGATGCSWSPPASHLVFPHCLPHCPGRELEAALLTCFQSCGLFCPLFQAPFLPNSVLILSTFASSLHIFATCLLTMPFAFFFSPIPSLPPPQKRRMKETTINQTCERAMLSDKFFFIWAPPLNKWKGMLF